MKCIVLFSICLFVSLSPVHSQTFSEWFEQKKTQIKYLTTQIAALGVYAKTLEKGYAIARDGLNLIGDIKKGDFHLHAGYFASLSAVNPKVRSYWKVAEMILLEADLLKNVAKHKRQLKNSSALSGDELSYIEHVYTQLLNGCLDVLTELADLTTDGKFALTDNERLARIDRLYTNMVDRYAFEQDFAAQASLLWLSRNKEMNDIEVARALNQLQ